MYEDVICTIGAPNKMVTDNAKVCIGIKWTTISCQYCIESGLSIPHRHCQNYTKNFGGNFKLAVLRLHHTHLYHISVLLLNSLIKLVYIGQSHVYPVLAVLR